MDWLEEISAMSGANDSLLEEAEKRIETEDGGYAVEFHCDASGQTLNPPVLVASGDSTGSWHHWDRHPFAKAIRPIFALMTVFSTNWPRTLPRNLSSPNHHPSATLPLFVGGRPTHCESGSMSTPRVRLTPIAGVGNHVGGSTWHIQQGRRGALIDFGQDFERRASMLGNRLRLRDNRGLLDPIELGLLPFYDGIYREDLFLDPDMLDEADDLDCRDLLLTHFHVDHWGQLYALDPSIRIHATLVTTALLHAATVAGVGLASEATHIVERIPHPTEDGILQKPRNADKTPRQFCVVDGAPNDEFLSTWNSGGSEGGLITSDMLVAGIPFVAHPVDHLLGASAFEIQTAQGPIVHSGDLRRHGSLSYLTDEFIAHLETNHPKVLILEGTRIDRLDDQQTTEAMALAQIRRIVKSAGKRLVVAAFGPNNFERLAGFLSAARQSKRELVIPARTMLNLEAIGRANPFFDLSDIQGLAVYDPPRSSRSPWLKELRERRSNLMVNPKQIRADPHRYILTHGHMDLNEWLDLKPATVGALFVYSASGAYSAEGQSDHATLKLWLDLLEMNAKGIEFKNGGSIVDPELCPSGHLHLEDIKMLLERARPELLLANHSSSPERFKDIAPQGTRVILPENGRTIRL